MVMRVYLLARATESTTLARKLTRRDRTIDGIPCSDSFGITTLVASISTQLLGIAQQAVVRIPLNLTAPALNT